MSRSFDDEGYLGKRLQDVLALATQQIAQVHAARGLVMPVEGTSTLHALAPGTRRSLTEIARQLGQSHQLIAQRLQRLVQQGLATKTADPNDGRRSEYQLTSLGVEQWEILDHFMDDVAIVNRRLFEEIGCDLVAALDAMAKALKHQDYRSRFAEQFAPERLPTT
ncbi:winged helix-turn-helix transcriptional regulator [Sphingomicrobium arenosum]|uniref:winged helix-turn-helix transcriptional regulator n=1 Tax=Sphingomicrobium arenosum TaxID=2233861 RepID=UPI00223F9F38|nr:MarR family transcriptional regulator [Sphingomicrobium arenosum]